MAKTPPGPALPVILPVILVDADAPVLTMTMGALREAADDSGVQQSSGHVE